MAADPVEVTCTKDTWVLVAQNVTTGMIHKRNVEPLYLMVTRETGNAAPLNDDGSWLAFNGADSIGISDSAAIDVYIKAVRVAGLVSVVL